MFSPLALAGVAAHVGGPFFPGLGLIFFIVVPLFFIGLFFLIGGLARRRMMRGGWGHGYAGHGYGPWGSAARGAESTLAERFAQGDIDEKEYRARLEVLRANNTATPPAAK